MLWPVVSGSAIDSNPLTMTRKPNIDAPIVTLYCFGTKLPWKIDNNILSYNAANSLPMFLKALKDSMPIQLLHKRIQFQTEACRMPRNRGHTTDLMGVSFNPKQRCKSKTHSICDEGSQYLPNSTDHWADAHQWGSEASREYLCRPDVNDSISHSHTKLSHNVQCNQPGIHNRSIVTCKYIVLSTYFIMLHSFDVCVFKCW